MPARFRSAPDLPVRCGANHVRPPCPTPVRTLSDLCGSEPGSPRVGKIHARHGRAVCRADVAWHNRALCQTNECPPQLRSPPQIPCRGSRAGDSLPEQARVTSSRS
ncbi:hypothetical protein STVIR_5259 [Streptomyces viridochromogenes Tue57]|uniref:Uncharacterized protein n=1 Tax=Streptomyces viridochromogenes Tue57 TaxID=1160705 RepID=L8PEN8_STRVR|nr:hypothetical protein STVIR_5259 [Streptomyces viridochromogenes Tue57]